jgi:hypothetical protein
VEPLEERLPPGALPGPWAGLGWDVTPLRQAPQAPAVVGIPSEAGPPTPADSSAGADVLWLTTLTPAADPLASLGEGDPSPPTVSPAAPVNGGTDLPALTVALPTSSFGLCANAPPVRAQELPETPTTAPPPAAFEAVAADHAPDSGLSQSAPAPAPTGFAKPADEAVPPVVSGPLVPVTGGSVSQAAASYNRLPATFVANQGQADPQVQFLAQGNGYTLALTSNEAVLDFQPGSADPATTDTAAPNAELRMQVIGAQPNVQAVGQDELPGKVNYFLGDDPSQWRTDLATFAQVEYPNIYPGISLDYYGTQQQLEYDFVVSPGVDPSTIALGFTRADGLPLDSQGNLVLDTANGPVRQNKPALYQDVNGVRQPVAGGFRLEGPGRVGFQVGAYDPSQPLVIDPVIPPPTRHGLGLDYSTYLGGTGDEDGFSIAVDSAGNAYVTGQTASMDFPTTSRAYQKTLKGLSNAYVAKINAGGTALVYSTYLGGSGNDRGNHIAVDSAGDAYVVGRTSSSNFPVKSGSFETHYRGGDYDAYLTKLAPGGNSLVYSTYLGGSDNDSADGVAVDAAGDAYVGGGSKSEDFPTTANAYAFSPYGTDPYLTVFNPTGSGLIYSTFFGGSFSNERSNSVAVDAQGRAFTTGYTTSPDFATTDNAQQPTYGGGAYDAFLDVFDPSRSGDASLLYGTYLGGSGDDRGFGIALDGAGNVYVTGETSSTNFPTVNALQPTYGGGSYDAFLTKYNSAGRMVYSTFLGGSGDDGATSVAVDAAGNVFLTGYTTSTNFPTQTAIQAANGGGSDAFVAEVDASGTRLDFSTYLGGSGDENTNTDQTHSGGIAVDAHDNIYVVGRTDSTDFPTAQPIQPALAAPGYDAFVSEITPPRLLSYRVR